MTSPPTDVPLPGAFDGPALAAAPEVFTHELAASVRTELGRLLDAFERGATTGRRSNRPCTRPRPARRLARSRR